MIHSSVKGKWCSLQGSCHVTLKKAVTQSMNVFFLTFILGCPINLIQWPVLVSYNIYILGNTMKHSYYPAGRNLCLVVKNKTQPRITGANHSISYGNLLHTSIKSATTSRSLGIQSVISICIFMHNTIFFSIFNLQVLCERQSVIWLRAGTMSNVTTLSLPWRNLAGTGFLCFSIGHYFNVR